MIVLDSTIMLFALPQAQHALGFSTSGRQWVIPAYTLGIGGLLLLGGRLGDRLAPDERSSLAWSDSCSLRRLAALRPIWVSSSPRGRCNEASLPCSRPPCSRPAHDHLH